MESPSASSWGMPSLSSECPAKQHHSPQYRGSEVWGALPVTIALVVV